MREREKEREREREREREKEREKDSEKECMSTGAYIRICVYAHSVHFWLFLCVHVHVCVHVRKYNTYTCVGMSVPARMCVHSKCVCLCVSAYV